MFAQDRAARRRVQFGQGQFEIARGDTLERRREQEYEKAECTAQ
jgi:hypothetical protein